MESSSEALHCGGSPWKRLLITASILSCWIQSTSAQGAAVTLMPNPPHGTVGSDVILDIHGFSGTVFTYNWYKGSIEEKNKIAFYNVPSATQTPSDIREKVFSNGSLLIPNLTLNDTDNYTVLIVEQSGQPSQAVGHLRVYENLSKPNLTANRDTNIIENDTMVFTCETEHNGIKILWFFKDQLLSPSERMNLSENNKTLTINNVTREDAGSYICEVWNPISGNKSDPLTLTVYFGPDNIRFSSSPEKEKIEVELKGTQKLECQVDSNPAAQYEWKINDTKVSNVSSNTFFINNATWEDSGVYTCLAKNNITNLSVSKNITVVVVEKKSTEGNGSSLSGGAIAGIVIGVLAGVALIGVLIYFLGFRKTGGASEHHLKEHKSSPPNHSQAHSDSSPKETEEVSYASVNFNAQKSPTRAQSQPTTDTVYSEIKKK